MATVGPRAECGCGVASTLGGGLVGRGAVAPAGMGLGAPAGGEPFGRECCEDPPRDVAGEMEAVGSIGGCGFTILSTSPNRFAFAVFKNAAFRA